DVVARGDLRYDAAIAGVNRRLGGHDVREEAAAVGYDAGRRFVAGSLDAQYQHAFKHRAQGANGQTGKRASGQTGKRANIPFPIGLPDCLFARLPYGVRGMLRTASPATAYRVVPAWSRAIALRSVKAGLTS